MPKFSVIDPRTKFWRVKLFEKIGEGPGAVIIQGWTRYIPALTREEAGIKAMTRHMSVHKGSQPKFEAIELESISKPIEI